MKRALIFVAAVLSISGCSSSNKQKVNIIMPELLIRQAVGPSDLGYPTGYVDIKYDVQVSNRSGEPITLRRIEVQSDATGAYQIQRRSFPFNEKIEPERFTIVSFWVHGYARGGARQTAPVTVRGLAYFDSPVGGFSQFFVKDIPQFESHPGS